MASIPSFIFGGDSKYKTQEELEVAREQVRAMLGAIGHSGLTGWGSAMADLGKGIGARIGQGRVDEGQKGLLAEQAKLSEMFGFGGDGGGAGSDVLVGGGGADSMAGGAGNEDYRSAIAGIESGGRYDAVGPRHPKMGRALGKYQIMESNIGPWSREVLGREVSPSEFMASPQLQDAIFDGKFGSYVAKYGPEGAARAWIGGPGGVSKPGRRDSLGTSVGEYGRRFSASLGGGDLSGGGGSNAQAGGGAGDSFLQAKPEPMREPGRYTRPRFDIGVLEANPDPGFEVNPAGSPLPDPGFEVNPAGSPLPDPGFEINPASPLDGRRRMTPDMMGGVRVDEPTPQPAPNPNRFGPPPLSSLPPRAGVGIFAPRPEQAYAPPAPQIYTPPAAPKGDRLGTPPPSMAGTETAPYPVPGRSMAGTETAPQFAPTPAQPPVPTARANPAVDPFTDMILGDKAAQFRPGNVTATPAAETARGLYAAQQLKPSGANVFPAAPPAPGTPAAAGFGVPQQAMAGGGGANRQVGSGGQFPPAPAAPSAGGGGGDKIAKLQFILASPYASKEQKLMAASMIEREYALQDETRKAGSPEAQLELQYKRAQIADLERKAAEGPGGEETWYGNPLLTERNGKMVYGVFSNKGNFKELPMPEGTSVVPPTKIIHTKTEDILVDQGGNVISRTPIQNREAAAETAGGTVTGTADAERLIAAEPQIASANQALDLLQQIRADPYLESGTGFSSLGNAVPGTGGYDFENLVKQAKSGAFLTAIPQLAGFGALSNTEGAAATAAIARLDTATSKEAFIKALDDYQAIIQTGIERAQRRLAEGGKTPPPAASGGEWITKPNGVKVRKKSP